MLPRLTREAARRFGDATAYVTPAGWALDYRDVDRLSDRVAAGLGARGIGSGDVVALVLPPGPEYLIAYLSPDYSQSIVARTKRDYVWIMARTPEIADSDYQMLLAMVEREGYDVGKVRRVPQRPKNDSHAQ